MPDIDHHKRPLPGVLTVAEFHARFGSSPACLTHFHRLRWGAKLERFVCPVCGHTVTTLDFDKCPRCSTPKGKFVKLS